MPAPRTPARKQCLFDLFITALEGGIGYWASVRDYHWRAADGGEDLDGFSATVIDGEHWSEAIADVRERLADAGESRKPRLPEVQALLSERGQWHVVNADTIARGLGRIKRGEVQLNQDMARNIKLFDRTNGAEGDPDAADADVIVQLGLFGALVYG